MDNNYIDEINDFIKNNKESDDIFCTISCKDLTTGKKIYNEIKKIQTTICSGSFGSNGGGLTCFGIYKSKEQIIYLIQSRIQSVVGYTIIDSRNEYYFDL